MEDIEVTSTPTGGFYDAGETITFQVTFYGPVTVTGTPQFGFVIGDRTVHANYSSGSDTTELVFSHAVTAADGDAPDGISWAADSLGLNGGSIKFMTNVVAQQVDANLDHPAQAALPAHKVDSAKPVLEEAGVDNATLALTFSEELDTTAPAATAFTVKVDAGSGANPTAVSIADNVVTLTLGSGVDTSQTVTVSYTKPGNNPIKDLVGKEADGFTDRAVEHLVDLENVQATPGDGQVELSWDNPNDTTVQKYQYRYMSTEDTGWNPGWTDVPGLDGTATGSRLSVLLTGLTNGIEYTFQVRPVYLQNGVDVFGNEAEIKSAPRGPLAAPSSLIVSTAGDGEVVMRWDNPDDVTITGYQYRYMNTGDTGWNPDWTDMPGSGATTDTHTLSGLTNNLLYTVELRAVRGTVTGPSASDVATPRGPIERPANFTATAGDRQVVLNWTVSIDDSILFYMYRYRTSTEASWNPGWTEIPDSDSTTATHTVTGLINGLEYLFQIRAMRGVRFQLVGPASATARAKPQGPLQAPAHFEASTNREHEIVLSWDGPTDATVTHFEYRVRRESGSRWDPDWRSVAGSGWRTTSETIYVTEYDERYVIELRPGRGGENGPSSQAVGVQRDRLGWPQNLHGTAGDGMVTLMWNLTSDDSVTGYQHRYGPSPGYPNWEEERTGWADIPGSSNSTDSHTVTGLTNDVEYRFDVRAMRGSSAGLSADVNLTPAAEPAPPATPDPPTGLSLSAGDGRLTATWDDVEDIESPRATITAFRVRYRESGAGSWDEDDIVPRGDSDRSSTQRITGLTNGVSYEVQVASVNQTVLSSWVSATGTPEAPPPPEPKGPLAAPAGLTATAGDGQVTLKWSNPNDNSITGYQYRRRFRDSNSWNPDWTAISGSGQSTTSHSVTGLSNGREYTFEVRAMRGSKGGPASSVDATPNTPLPAPANLSATTDRDYEIILTWSGANDSSIDGWEYRTRRQGGGSWTEWWFVPGGGPNTTSVAITVATFNDRYDIELRAERGIENGPASQTSGIMRDPRDR